MTLVQLEQAYAAAHKRATDAKDKIDADDATADLDALGVEFDEAIAEVERTKKNLETRARYEATLAAEPEVPAGLDLERASKLYPSARGAMRTEMTYRPDDGPSFFSDLRAAKGGDQTARDRMVRNNTEYAIEKRAGLNQTATTAGEFIPPVWAIDKYAAKLRAGRPGVSAIGTSPWPAGTNSLNFPAITTGAAVAVQTDGNTVQNTDWVTSSYTAQAQTCAGRTVASYQLLDLGWAGIDGIIYSDLVADYARIFDVSVVNGSVTNAKGLLNTTGINAVTYTTATPKQVDSTVANSFYYQHFLSMNAIQKNAFMAPDLALIHPSTWNWFLTGLDTANRPLSIAMTGVQGFNATSAFDPTVPEPDPGFSGNIAGTGIVVDANIPVNLGGGTNESRYIMLNRRGFDIFETQPTFKVADQTSIATLQYQFVLWGYYAVVSRQPKAISVVAGTGMIVQSGF